MTKYLNNFPIEEENDVDTSLEDNTLGVRYVGIYALADPRTEQIHYVGRSNDIQRRYKEHIADARRYMTEQAQLWQTWGETPISTPIHSKLVSNARKLQWISTLLHLGLEPQLVILDEWQAAKTVQDENRLEDAWIAHMKLQGQVLFNYIYSHRQRPTWYTNSKREEFAKSPLEYIERLKSGEINVAKKKTRSDYYKANGKNNRYPRRRVYG